MQDSELNEMKMYIAEVRTQLDTLFSTTDEPLMSVRKFVAKLIQENMDYRAEHARMLTHVEETDKKHYEQRKILKQMLSLCIRKVNQGEKFNQPEADKINKLLEKL